MPVWIQPAAILGPTLDITTWLPLVATVLGSLVAGGAVALYLARPNKEKLTVETAKVAEETRKTAVETVELALDRQDKVIDRQDKTIADQAIAISSLDTRVAFLEAALAKAGVEAHIAVDAADARAALAEGKIVVLKSEIDRLGGIAPANGEM